MVSFVHSLAGEAFCVALVSGLQAQYAVTGFVWHGNDHYVAYLVHGQKWYCLNDAVVSEVAPGDLPSEACLVFLEKVVRLRAKSTRSCPRRSSPAPNALWLRLPEALAKAATQPAFRPTRSKIGWRRHQQVLQVWALAWVSSPAALD